jgi:alpha-L-arabinofuranosidase
MMAGMVPQNHHSGSSHSFCGELRSLPRGAFKNLTPRWWFALAGTAFLALTSPALANDDMLIYSGYTNIVYGTMNYNNGWQDWGWVPHYYTNNPAFNGTNSIVFAADSSWQALHLEHDPIDTTLYTNLTLWLNGGPKGRQTVGVQAEAGTNWGTQMQVTAPTNGWQQFTFSLASLGVANITNLTAIEIWNGGTLQSNFYIAGITLVAASTPAIVHVGVNATNSVRTVDSRVFSINTAAWDGYLDTPSTISILTNMNNQALRWPGGSWGDTYFMTNEPQGWGSRTTNFIHVATNTHAQVYFIVNYGSGTTNQAADWVRFCNITNHCSFKYWEVGNENYGDWEEDINTNMAYFGREVAHDPWTYAMRFKDYYNAMKAVDPTIKIGAVAVPDETSYVNNTNHPAINPVTGTTNYGWTAVMLNTMRTNGVTPDFLIEHNYAPSDGDTYNLLWTKTWVSDAASLRQIVNDYLGSTVATNIELVDTEFVPEGDKQWISLVGGLFAADAVGKILQTEFNALLWWDLRNGQGSVTNSDNALYGWRTNSSGYFITDEGCVNGNVVPPNSNCYPSYYCMKLMQYFARGGDTVVTVTNDCQLLGTYAVRRTNGSLTMLVVNKSSYASLNAAINLSGYVLSSNATVYSYGIPQDDAARTGIGSQDIAQTNFPVTGTNFNYTFTPYSATVLSFTPVAPVITTQPTSQSVYAGQNASFTVIALGAQGYQWQRNGSNLPGANSSTLTLTNARPQDAGIYMVVVSNITGSVTSTYAMLRVWTPSGVAAWGCYAPDVTDAGQINVPPGLTNAVAIAGGFFHSLALKSDGTVVAWGDNEFGQTNVPSGLTNVVAITGGEFHSLALKNDGTVVAWGDNNHGETNVPSDLTNVVAIDATGLHSLALKNDGTVVAWGYNAYGQTNVPTGLTNVVAIAGGALHSLALKSDGTLVAWGEYSWGQTNIPSGLTNVVAISAGTFHNLVLKSDGTVVAWGHGDFGETNVPLGLTNVVAISAAGPHNLALKNDGTVANWGGYFTFDENWYEVWHNEPAAPAGLTNVVAVAEGWYHSLALENLPPVITQQPTNQTVIQGSNATFTVTATGTMPLSYQWYFNSVVLDAATNATLSLNGVQTNNAGNYYAVVSNPAGSVTSSNAVLTVNPQTLMLLNVGLQPAFVTANSGDRSIRLTFNGIPEHTYQIEYTEDLSHPAWKILTMQKADSFGVCQFADEPPVNAPTRFYRVVQP